VRRAGVLLVNLGTPDSPAIRDVRRYLREFLSDPLVMDIPALPRWLILHCFILPFRPRKSAAAYRQIWTAAGSPLLTHGERLRDGVAQALGEGYAVELAMRYGEPSIRGAVERLASAGVARRMDYVFFMILSPLQMSHFVRPAFSMATALSGSRLPSAT
jgi:ferrochelatase